MNWSEVRLGENNRNILIGVAALVLAGIFALYFYFGVADKDITQDITQETEPVFQITSERFSYTPGEVKVISPNIGNLVLASVKLEGRIVSEPVRNNDLYEFVVFFPKAGGESVETTVTLPAGGDQRIGVVVANNGIIGDETGAVTHNAIFISEVIPLINKGEPIQLSFSLHEITNELREQVMSHSVCQGSPEGSEFCQTVLDDIERWYGSNLQLVKAVESNGELPENHRIGAVLELVIFDDR